MRLSLITCLGGCHRWKMVIKMLGKQQRSTRCGRSKSPVIYLSTWPALTLTHRFIFPSEPPEGVIDLTTIEYSRSFYFNPYSGELSLEFPKAEVKCPGGILA